MKKIIRISLVIIGIVLGLYLGLWQMFIGGILAIARAIDGNNLTATLVAWNVVKILLASPIGGGIFYLFIASGLLISD